MSLHNNPKYQIPALVDALKQHGLKYNIPSQLADAFRTGWVAALATPVQAAALVTPSDDGFMAAVNEMDGLYAAPLAITSAPKRIWLDLGFNPYEDNVHFDNLHDLTWSQNNATGDGIEYVRADLAALTAPAQAAAPDMTDAYAGAREDLSIWKKRALEAEALNRKFAASVNSPSFMGEPAALATPTQAVQQDAERYRWLRKYAIGAYITVQGKGSTVIYLLTKAPALDGIGEETDKAIDAARAAQKKP